MKRLFQNPGIWFIVKFLLLFAVFYFGTYVVIGLCAPGGVYSPFIAKYGNYIKWLRISILHGAQMASSILGLQTVVPSSFVLKIVDGPSVKMVYSCIGFGVMSFWAAFVIAQTGSLVKKLGWLLGGLFAIWFINCWRVALLLYTLHNNGNINAFAEHHTVFNIISYILVFVLMYFFTRKPSHKIETEAIL